MALGNLFVRQKEIHILCLNLLSLVCAWTTLHTKAGFYHHWAQGHVSKVPRHLKICFYLFPPAGCLLVFVTERVSDNLLIV